MSEPNERDRAVAADINARRGWDTGRCESGAKQIAEYREEIQAECLLRSGQWELNAGNRPTKAELRAEVERLKARLEDAQAEALEPINAWAARNEELTEEVERLKQELGDMTHKYRNQCDATDGQTEQLAFAEGALAEEVSEPLTAKQIVQMYLEAAGYDGLFSHERDCGCTVDEFAPCGEMGERCMPGFRGACRCGDHDFHIYQSKELAKKADKAELREEVEIITREVAVVYDNLTMGRISKPNTAAADVLHEIQELQDADIDERTKELREEVERLKQELQAARELLIEECQVRDERLRLLPEKMER